jgi:lipopolysaccharide export system protein LptC
MAAVPSSRNSIRNTSQDPTKNAPPQRPALDRDMPPRLVRMDRLSAAGAARIRQAPTASRIARRRVMVTLTKWLLPLCALLLLALIALWPEIARIKDQGRIAFRRAFNIEADSGRMKEPRYRGVDERGRPFTVTADSALQSGPLRIDLVEPKGDLVPENGGWIMVEAHEGVFIQHAGQLDLSHDVVLYRDDGTVMRTQSAAVDTKQGAAASDDMTHAEGPFGVLDAQGFTLTDKGAAIQFHGPARLILNERK